MEDGAIEFSTYTDEELREVTSSIDARKYPVNYARLQKELDLRKAGLSAAPKQLAEPNEVESQSSDSIFAVAKLAAQAIRREPLGLLMHIMVPALIGVIPVSLIPPGATITYTLAATVGMIACIVMAVRLHRFILLLPLSRDASVTHHLRLGAWCVLLLLPITAWLGGAWLLPKRPPLALLWLMFGPFPMFYFIARLSLGLPDRALGRATPFSQIWSWSRGRGWWLTGALYIPVCLFTLIVELLIWLTPNTFDAALRAALTLPLWVVQIALLSCSYQLLANAPTMNGRGDR